ncbi:MAG: zinc-dependent metalloprotease [Cryomorphaceae bacterium]|nr:zinc-dependent metalloprotease [Cryomorphaceae bacterium]
MKNFYALTLSLTLFFAHAQVDTVCGISLLQDSLDLTTLPYYGNNQFLFDFRDSIDIVYSTHSPESGEDYEGGFDEDVYFWIPVKAWVYNDDNGQGGISENQVRQSIKVLNERFKGEFSKYPQSNGHTNIQFYLKCDISYINSDEMALNANLHLQTYWNNNFEWRCINIHYVQSSNDIWRGVGQFPWSSLTPFSTAVVTSNDIYLSSTLAHEIGHNLGLHHTHHYPSIDDPNHPNNNHYDYNGIATPCFQESVSRSRLQGSGCHHSGEKKCEITGDIICDTEADPGLLGQVSGTTYTGTGTDNWNDSWTPNVFNYMSYAPLSIREFFSDGQIGVMQFYITGGDGLVDSWLQIHHKNDFIDIYEPDDVYTDASEIQIGSPQLRGLHGIPDHSSLSNPNYDFCNQDWVKFTLTSTKTISIRTQPIEVGVDEVNTSIELFSDDATTSLAFNENNIPQDKYSSIMDISLPAGDYYILVKNEGNKPGKYVLYLEDCGTEECCFQPILTKTEFINPWTNSPFNIGHRNANIERIDRDLTVVNNGVLGCNISSPIGSGNIASGSMGNPTPNSHVFVDVCNDAEIVINKGSFVLGDPTDNLSSEVTINSGSVVKFLTEGKLVINNNSKLIIEDGGGIEFLEGAQIELVGPNSILEIRGKVTVGDNAIFTFSGDGRIIIDQFIYKGVRDNFWDIGEDAKLILEGPTDYGQVLLECKSNFSPVMEDNHTFAEVKIHKGQVLLHPGKHASITSPAFINKVEFNLPSGISTSDRHGGLKIWGRYNDVSYIHYNRFLNGNFGIKANQSISNPQPLVLHGNHFESNYHGLYIIGQSFTAQASTFKYNAYGLYGTDLHGTGLVNNCDFEENTVGCFLSGQGGSETQIAHSVFDATQMMASYSNPVGLQLEDYSVSLNCNNFSNLYYGIEFFGVNVSIDLSEDKRNRFFEAKNAIYGNITNGYFNMLAGNNGFFNNTSHDVWISASNNLSGPLNGNQIDFSENTMAQVFQWGWINVAAPNIGGAYTPTTNGSHPFNHCEGSILEYPSINEVMEVQMFTSNTYVNLPGGGGGNLIDVTVMAGEQITNSNDPNEILDDYKAFEDLTDISNELINQFSTLSATDKHVFFLILRMMEKALHQIYKQELLPYNDDYFESAAQEILDFNDIIDQLLGLLGTPSDTVEYERATALKLQTVHNYRQGGYLQDAVNTLFNYEPIHVGEKTLDRWLYWDCICNVEAEFMQGIIDEEVFDQDLMTCITSYAPRMFKMFEDPDVPLENNKTFSLKTYPNPTSEFLYFQTPGINDPETNLDIHLYSINGVEVYNNQAEASFVQRIDVKHLPPGNYVLKVVADGQIKTKKVIIQ